ncbi:MAG TPA: thymidine kinase [Candidatus Saccharimonadia bacterium]|nr:thymidine kinase [Candidatus Saccharimonadia bacterium]
MGRLIYFCGTMGSGKSTLALQMHYNFAQVGRLGLLFTQSDRSSQSHVTSRIGLSAPALMVGPRLNLYTAIKQQAKQRPLSYVLCDEVQFYAPEQIEQLAQAVDELKVDGYGFGITTDFRSRLFHGSARMIELADDIRKVQSEMPCWCGQPATHNGRVVAGQLVTEGEQVVVGDLSAAAAVQYVVLCRPHYRARRAFA